MQKFSKGLVKNIHEGLRCQLVAVSGLQNINAAVTYR
jgi:hypothetical protein